MTATYRLNVNELSAEIVNSIKEAFKGKEIEIVVTESVDETAYLLSSDANREMLETAMYQVEHGEGKLFTVADFEAKYGNK